MTLEHSPKKIRKAVRDKLYELEDAARYNYTRRNPQWFPNQHDLEREYSLMGVGHIVVDLMEFLSGHLSWKHIKHYISEIE